jgi:hypothetical protein
MVSSLAYPNLFGNKMLGCCCIPSVTVKATPRIDIIKGQREIQGRVAPWVEIVDRG